MTILAIDPGTEKSAYVLMDGNYTFMDFGKEPNEFVRRIIEQASGLDAVVIEHMEPRYAGGGDSTAAGRCVGESSWETAYWIGEFRRTAKARGVPVERIYRREERSTLIPSKRNRLPALPPTVPRHADGQIRAALIQRFARFDKENGRGTKGRPDVFYGFSGDMWQAAAVGVTWLSRKDKSDAEKAADGQ